MVKNNETLKRGLRKEIRNRAEIAALKAQIPFPSNTNTGTGAMNQSTGKSDGTGAGAPPNVPVQGDGNGAGKKSSSTGPTWGNDSGNFPAFVAGSRVPGKRKSSMPNESLYESLSDYVDKQQK